MEAFQENQEIPILHKRYVCATRGFRDLCIFIFIGEKNHTLLEECYIPTPPIRNQNPLGQEKSIHFLSFIREKCVALNNKKLSYIVSHTISLVKFSHCINTPEYKLLVK